MDRSPALENFMNKMATMQGQGKPKMSATSMKIGSGSLDSRVANNEKKITILKNIFKAQRQEIGEKITPKVSNLEQSLLETTNILGEITQKLQLDYSQRLEEQKNLFDQQRKDNLDKKRDDKEEKLETVKKSKITKKLALELSKVFLEVVIANNFDGDALKILKVKKNLRLIDASNLSQNEILKFNSISNSMIVQTEDNKIFSKNNFKVVSKKKPSKSQFNNLIFAFNICRYVKSNAIVLASNYSTIGIGSGQPSRLDSCEIAINKMNKFSKTKNEIVAASDAFFPFVDGIEKLVQSGASAVIQPSGSIRDKEIIKFANATETVLVFSKTRHFRH